MRFAFWTENSADWATIEASCRHAVDTGWDGVYFADHFLPFMGPEDGPVHECWSVLAGLAAVLPPTRLGALVTGNTYRHPAVLLQQAVSVDHILGGGCVLGLGAGWQENEHRAYGIDYGTASERLDRLDEACQVIRALLDGEPPVRFAGDHYVLDRAPLNPRPIGDMPLLVGGGGEKRTLRIAARYADEWNVWGDPELLAHKMGVLDAHCADVGRDPTAIARSAVSMLILSDDGDFLARMRGRDFGHPCMVGTPAEIRPMVEAYVDAGVDELVIPDFTMPSMEIKREMLDRFQAEVAAEFR